MVVRRGAIGGLALVLSLGLAGCGGGTATDRDDYFQPIRYRLTAEVETPEGPRTAFSVIEAKTNRSITRVKAKGEAVAVDLPNGQVLFVLLRSASSADWAVTLPGIPMPEAAISPQLFEDRQAQLERQLAAVSRDRAVHYLWGGDVPKERARYLPYMVRFRDLADPKSVEQVAPDDLGKTFGAGYRLKSLAVQVTDEQVTTGIGRRLTWLQDYRSRNARLNGSSSTAIMTNELSDVLGTGAFLIGIEK